MNPNPENIVTLSQSMQPLPKYSICITHFNNLATLEGSMGRIQSQIDSRFEVVVVDNFSTDGSADVLKKYAKEGMIRLLQEKCSRGRGRQIAFDNSRGEYVISGLDMDDFLSPRLEEFVQLYHRLAEGYLIGSPATMGPASLIRELGGWRDVNWYEDWDLWRRAANRGKFAVLDFVLFESRNRELKPKTLLAMAKANYTRALYGYQVNKHQGDVWLSRSLPILALAWFHSRLKESYGKELDSRFNPKAREYFRSEEQSPKSG